MKKLIITTIIFICTLQICYSQSGWVYDLFASANNINSVKFLNANTGWCVGSNGRVYKSTNGGINWSLQSTPTTHVLLDVAIATDQKISAIGTHSWYTNQYVFITSIDGGTSWQVALEGSTEPPSTILFVNEFTGFASGSDLLYKTTNSGINWFIYATISNNEWTYGLSFINENTGWTTPGAVTSKIIKTTNGGSGWTQIYSFAYYDLIKELQFINELTGWATGFHIDPQNGIVFKTTDGGYSWTNLYSCTSLRLSSSSFINSNTGWAVGYNGTICFTSNSGSQWITQQSPVTGLLLDVFFINNYTGWIATWGGIIRTTTGGFTGIEPINNIIPEDFSLHQNYPNPFNPSTKISFSIPLSRGVSVDEPAPYSGSVIRGGVLTILIIYDVIGREVATLVNEQLKPGTYEVEFDGSSYASGVYFYSLITDDFAESKKMLMIK